MPFTRPALLAAMLSALTSTTSRAAATGVLNPPRSPRNANYTITARLDPSTRTITATETIAWRNITENPTSELRFHLYWNAWKNPRTTFMRERALGSGRESSARAEDDWARIDINVVKVLGRDLTGAKRYIARDDDLSTGSGASRAETRTDNPYDETVMAIPLPEPIAPGAGATIDISWTAHVPRTFARTGAIGNFFFIAQWFPKLGVLQNEGWNCHQFHAGTEFFSDYGVYDVSLTVPNGWIVGATGVQTDRRNDSDTTTTHRYYQEDVHDFAWTTSRDYLERSARFEHPSLPPVEMRLLLQPEHAAQADRHFIATRTTLKYYGEWYGAYPYGHITIVDPAWQSGAGGMEYPTLFTAGTRWLAPARVTTPEEVTVHEAGHQFWYGIVGNNEFEDAWMDEGFNQFSTARAVGQAYAPNYLAVRYFGGFIPWVFKDIALQREIDGNGLPGYRRNAKSDAQSTPTYRYFPGTGGNITYSKTALWLNTLERSMGWPWLQKIMTAHFGRWQFKHPRPQDFFDTVNQVGGQDLTWFFDQVYRSSNAFDYGIQDLRSTRDDQQYHTTVVARRYGEARFPVDVVVTFRNGERVTEHWDGADRWKLYTYDRPSQALSAQLDPQRVLLMDVDYTNNSKTLEPKGSVAATKWSLAWTTWLEDCLLSWAALI